jgi:hypothetical protein
MLASIVFALASVFLHVPPGSVPEGRPLRIAGRMPRDARVVVSWRAAGAREVAPAWNQAEPLRTESGEFVVELAASRIAPPGIEYFITADGQPVFASPELPYFVTVVADDETILARSALRANGGLRSRARVATEWVDFGSRGDFSDHYWRAEGDYSYSLYRAVYRIRMGGGVLRGDTFVDNMAESAGLDYGFAEIRWRLSESVFLDTRGMLGADNNGFQPGGAVALLLGKPEGVYVALGGDVEGRVGSQGYLSLHWDTIPTVPMSATVALSDFPSQDRPTGVRLLVDASHVFGAVEVVATAGYQARDIHVGGATLGLALQHSF